MAENLIFSVAFFWQSISIKNVNLFDIDFLFMLSNNVGVRKHNNTESKSIRRSRYIHSDRHTRPEGNTWLVYKLIGVWGITLIIFKVLVSTIYNAIKCVL